MENDYYLSFWHLKFVYGLFLRNPFRSYDFPEIYILILYLMCLAGKTTQQMSDMGPVLVAPRILFARHLPVKRAAHSRACYC